MKFIIANISIIVAIISVIIAYSGAKSSKKSLKLQQTIYNESIPNISLEINKSFLFDKKGLKNIYFYIETVISNNSDKNNAIKKMNLKIVGDSITANIEQTSNKNLEYNNLKIFNLPLNLNHNSSTKGWLVFKIEKSTYNKLKPNSYYLIAEDINNNKYSKKEILIKEEIIGYE